MVARPARRWAIAAMLAAALPLAAWLSLRPDAQTQSADPIAAGSQPRETVAPHSAAPRDAGVAQTTQLGDATPAGPSATIAKAPAAATDHTTGTVRNHSDREPLDPTRVAATRPTVSNRPKHQASPAADKSATTAIAHSSTRDNGIGDSATPRIADASAHEAGDRIARQLLDLQAESARLEALVALTRDDRVANASATVMSADLDQRLGLIDAGLTDAAMSNEQRLALWQQRVGALRSLAGVESTQRWFAARGEHYGDALVRVD